MVKKRHNELISKNPLEVRKVFIDFLVSRPLFGTTIYDVTVNFYTLLMIFIIGPNVVALFFEIANIHQPNAT
jgi:hypothetical protein